MGVGLFGGAFDPPHNGHVALLEAADRRLGLERIVVLVAADPGHKRVHAPAEARLELAAAAFPGHEVRLDSYARTVDMLRGEKWEDATFLIGADQFGGFGSWKEPDAVLELARLGVAARPGYPRPSSCRSDRVTFFEIPQIDVSSSEVRRRCAAGEPIDDLVPAAVAALIRESGLYVREPRLDSDADPEGN